MPFFEQDDTTAGGLAPQVNQGSAPPAPDFFADTLPAAFRQINTVGSAADWAASQFSPRTLYDVDVADPFANIAGYEDFASSFIGADTDADVRRIKTKIDRERADRETLGAAGGEGVVAALAAGLFDPVNLIPIGGFLAKAGQGYSVLRGLGAGMKGGLLAGVASEAVLYGTQETRTARESLWNVAESTLVVGVLGAAVPALANVVKGMKTGDALADVAKAVERDTTVPAGADPLSPGFLKMSEEQLLADVASDMVPAGSTAGAKAVRDTTLAEETLKSALGIEKTVSFQDPLLRAATSPNVEVRRVMQELAESPLMYEKNALGIASPVAVETRMKMWQANLARGVKSLDDAFVKHRTGQGRGLGDVAKLGIADTFGTPAAGKLTYQQFREEVGRALRRGDQHAIPEVSEAAAALRREVFDPLKDRAIAAGLLPEDVKPETALSYLTRVYDVPKIVARRGEFEGRIVDWMRGYRETAGQRMAEARAKIDTLTPKVERLEQELSAIDGQRKATNPEDAGELQLSKKAWKEARFDVAGKERDLAGTKKALDQATREFNKAKDRLERLSPTTIEKDDPLVTTLRDLRRGVPEPMSLTKWVRKIGGLSEEGGEVRAIDAKGVLNNKSGTHPDDAALRAWEEGFFPGEERPDMNTFMWALREDANGRSKVYREADWEVVAYREYLDDFAEELDRRGIEWRTTEDAKIKSLIEADAAGIDPRFVASTPATRARSREIGFYQRRAEALAGKAKERFEAASKALAEAKAKRDAARVEYHGNVARVANLEGELRRDRAALEKATRAMESDRSLAALEDLELEDVARQITDNITGAAPGRLAYEPVPLARGPMKERTLAISDYAIEDFLESDAEVVSRIYSRTMSADAELATAFGRADLGDQLDKIRDHYAILRRGVTDEATLKALDERLKADLRDVEAVRDRLRGTYALPRDHNSLIVRASRVARNWNYIRLLGGMTLSAIPDLARSVMVHGVSRVVGDGLAPMVKNFRGFKLAGEEAKLAGTALDMILDNRAMQLADVWDDYGRLSKFERGVQSLTNRFGVVSLMAPWNTAMKEFSAVVTQARMLKAITAGPKAARAEVERLAFLGIDPMTADRIAEQFAAHGDTLDGGVLVANTAKWTDREAVEAFRAAMVKEVDRIIVTPGQDKPLWMSTELGKTIGQFKSFAIASTQRTALAGLQQRDAAALNGALLAVGLGMVRYGVYGAVAGYAVSDDPLVWVKEGFDASGLLFWLTDASNIGGKLTGFGTTTTRYASRSASEALLGPTLGSGLDTTLGVAAAVGHGEWKESDTRALRRLLPYQNLFYLRQLFDEAEESINEVIGAEG